MPPKKRAPQQPGTPAPENPMRIPVHPSTAELLAAEAAEEGCSVSDLVRERVDAATAVTDGDATTAPPTAVTVRLDAERRRAVEAAASATELEPATWLRLILSPAGKLLMKQLQRVHTR
jgi:hypothetical protein